MHFQNTVARVKTSFQISTVTPLVPLVHAVLPQVAGALVKTLLDLSLQLKVPVINGLCFSLVMESDLNALGGRLARGAMNMAAVREGAKESYSGTSTRYFCVYGTSALL